MSVLNLNIQEEISKLHYYSQDATSNFLKAIEISNYFFDNDIADSRVNFYRGRANQELGQLKESIPFYTRSIQLNDPYSWTKETSSHNLARVHFALDNYDECIKTCTYNMSNSQNIDWKSHAEKVDIDVFPELSVSGYNIGVLFEQQHSVALKYKDENPIMLTSDNGLQIKAKGLKITTITLKDLLKQLKY